VTIEHTSTVVVGRYALRTVIRMGEPDGVPLLLCNGIGAPNEALKPFVEALDPRVTAIRFDVPGVGGSPMSRVPLPYSVLASMASRLVRQLGFSRFDVLGISWGGALAQQLAFQNPRRCRRVVLAATAAGWLMLPARPQVLRHMATPGRYRDPAYARAVAPLIYGGAVRKDPGLAKSLLVDSDRPPSLQAYLYQLLAGAGWTSLPVLPLIRQPVLILAGTDDPIIPLANAKIMARLLPRTQLHTYNDGHLALVTSVQELAPVVSTFLLERS
jgi:poly(3-hydroxyalkanoate) depolymerase